MDFQRQVVLGARELGELWISAGVAACDAEEKAILVVQGVHMGSALLVTTLPLCLHSFLHAFRWRVCAQHESTGS